MNSCQTIVRWIKNCFCLFGICESISEEYWQLEEEFYQLGCSLHPIGILKKSVFVATLFSTILSVITIMTVLIIEGLSKPGIFQGVVWNLAQIWLFLFASVWATHILWILTFIIARKLARVECLKGVTEKIWGGPVFQQSKTFEDKEDEDRGDVMIEKTHFCQDSQEPVENVKQTSGTRKLN